MFIKLPSGMIIQIDKIVRCVKMVSEELRIFTVEDNEPFYLTGEDAKRLYEYLESISMQ